MSGKPRGIKEYKIKGSELAEKVREIIHEGNARRLIVKKDDRVFIEIPLSVGVTAAVATLWLAPLLAALGALGALVSDVSVTVEHEETPASLQPQEREPESPENHQDIVDDDVS